MKKEISKIIDGRRVIVKKPELLAPAGDLEKLKTAVIYGADAVFVGGKEFSLRSLASNFTIEDIKEATKFCHEHGAHIHITTNIILHEDNLEGLEDYLMKLDAIGIDAIIAADPHVILTAKRLGCHFETHLSTQMSSLNSEAVNFFASWGCERVVLGREVTYECLKDIMDNANCDIEYFIHGAMCINYSGRCMLSNHYSKRDANRGGCAQSCRWLYDVVDHEDYVPFTLSGKDLASPKEIPALIEAGVDSFKIEGRMKSVHYIATVVSTYRKLIDAYCADPDHFVYDEWYDKEILKAANRALNTGFFYGLPNEDFQLYDHRDEHPTQQFVMRVLAYDSDQQEVTFEVRNHFKVGDEVEFFSPNYANFNHIVDNLKDEDGNEVLVANHPMAILTMPLSHPMYPGDMARKVRK